MVMVHHPHRQAYKAMEYLLWVLLMACSFCEFVVWAEFVARAPIQYKDDILPV